MAHLWDRKRREGNHEGQRNPCEQSAPAPHHDRSGSDADRQRDEARLRKREEEADPHRGDEHDQPPHLLSRHAAQQDAGKRGEDPDDEVAPVDRRVPEHRVDAEERRVRVPDLHLGIPEDLTRRPLVHPDRGIHERRPDETAPQPGQPAPAPRESCDAHGQEAERQDERPERDRAFLEIVRPEERDARPQHEGRQRQCDRPELTGTPIALADDLPEQTRDRPPP